MYNILGKARVLILSMALLVLFTNSTFQSNKEFTQEEPVQIVISIDNLDPAIYKDILLLCPVHYGNKKVTETNLFIKDTYKPTFFGHYWLNDEPSIKNPNAICLDYSIAKNGKLVAYSFNNEKAVSNKNLSYV